MFNSVLNMSADDVIGKNVMRYGANNEQRNIVVTHMLEWLLQERQVYWTLGGGGVKIRNLGLSIPLDLSVYDTADDRQIIYYLAKHPVDDVLMGRDPDMVPDRVQIVEGDNVEICFSLSEELRASGIDSSYRLDDDAIIGIDVPGDEKNYVLHYVARRGRLMPRLITIYRDNGARSYATFNTAIW